MFDPTAFFTQYQALKGVKPETWDKLSQTWPARMAQSAWNAATLPGDVWNGKVDPLSEEGIGRATDLAGLTMSSTLASPRGSIGVGPVLPKKPNPMAVEPPTPMTMTPPQGIRAYHGSPHDFDKFDISKIGTGEGAQAYGHGLYFADNSKVAEGYRNTLTNFRPDHIETMLSERGVPQHVANTYAKWAADTHGVGARSFDDFVNLINASGPAPRIEEFRASIRPYLSALKDNLDATKGRMYEVNINARPDQFLDWDKPLSQQNKNVQGAFEKFVSSPQGEALAKEFHSYKPNAKLTDLPEWQDPYGGTLYRNAFGGWLNSNKALQEAGIPGIRYLDQGSRGQGNGTFNYVVFNDALIDILKKYGIAGMAAAPVIAGAVNQQEPVANY